jgi:hypothetical protein
VIVTAPPGSNLHGVEFPGPNDILTWPAVEGLVDEAISPFLKLLPRDWASSFQADVEKAVQKALAEKPLTITTGGIAVISIAVSGVTSYYIGQLAERAEANCTDGAALCAFEIGAGINGLNILANSVIVYISTPPLWPLGWAGAAAALGLGVFGSTTGEVIDLIRLVLGK